MNKENNTLYIMFLTIAFLAVMNITLTCIIANKLNNAIEDIKSIESIKLDTKEDMCIIKGKICHPWDSC